MLKKLTALLKGLLDLNTTGDSSATSSDSNSECSSSKSAGTEDIRGEVFRQDFDQRLNRLEARLDILSERIQFMLDDWRVLRCELKKIILSDNQQKLY